MTDVIKTLYEGPEAFSAAIQSTDPAGIFEALKELQDLLRKGTDIPAMEETRQQIHAAREALQTLEQRAKLGQVALRDWENAINHRCYELTKEDAA